LDGTPNTTTQELPDFFVSRAGADAPFAEAIGHIIENAGHRVVLQQWDFANRNFMEQMHAALSSGARVIALLSNEYLASKHCEAEWQNAIATDPLNTNARLIVLRVNECTPRGLLTALAYWDLVPIRDRSDLVRDVVLTAIKPGPHKGDGLACEQYWRAARTVLHPEIKPTASFTGRAQELLKIGNALHSGDTAAITQPAAMYGLGGIGKSTLAREYAHQAQDGYAGVWWLDAARAKDSKSWEGLERGLVDLGTIFIRGLDQVQNRAAAARQTLEFIANGGFAKPWLLVYDNVDDPAVLRQWAPVGNARLLVTSRLGAWGAGIAKIEVEEWAMPEAVSYLLKESGRSDLTVTNAQAIATALGRLPLALSHAAPTCERTRTLQPRAILRRSLNTCVRHLKVPSTAGRSSRLSRSRSSRSRHGRRVRGPYSRLRRSTHLMTYRRSCSPKPLSTIRQPWRKSRPVR
jgi:TIR domain-containing protein